MSKNLVIVGMGISSGYLEMNPETGEFEEPSIFPVISCDIDPEKEVFKYYNYTPPLPPGMSHGKLPAGPFFKKASKMTELSSFEMDALEARGVRVEVKLD